MRPARRLTPRARGLSMLHAVAMGLPVLAILAMSRLLIAGGPEAAKGEAEPKPSSYAPAKDLLGSLDGYVRSLEQDLGDAAAYDEDRQSRVAKDANTIAVLALVLGKHDEEHKLKAAAPALVQAASRLGEHAGKYEQAVGDLAAIQKALESREGGELQWKPVADIQQLMRQVPIVNNSLRRGVTGRRFDRTLDQNAGYAATLAAIAQASMYDTNYCDSPAAEKRWVEICGEMRDAAAAVHQAIRKADQDTARKGLDRLVVTCDACHAEFRD